MPTPRACLDAFDQAHGFRETFVKADLPGGLTNTVALIRMQMDAALVKLQGLDEIDRKEAIEIFGNNPGLFRHITREDLTSAFDGTYRTLRQSLN